MKLTLEQIKSITVGAVNVYEEDTKFHFRRFTDRQLKVWAQVSDHIRDNSYGTAGCRLSFYTDARNMILGVGNGTKLEIFIDGLPAEAFQLTEPRRLPIALGDGEKHVEILLPNYTEAILTSLVLDEGAYIRPYTYSRKFLFLGDSITQGSQSSRDSFCYVNRVTHYFDAQCMNLGIGASTMTPDTLEDVGYDPDAVFIAYGTNDFNVRPSIEELEAHCKEYFDRVQKMYPNKKIFYISPLWRAEKDLLRKTGTLDQCRERLIYQCEAHGFIHIDGYTLVPHMPFYFKDGYLHPNDLGFSYYAENLIKFLTKYL